MLGSKGFGAGKTDGIPCCICSLKVICLIKVYEFIVLCLRFMSLLGLEV